MKNLLFTHFLIVGLLSKILAHAPAEVPIQLIEEIDLELQMDSPAAAPIYSNYPITLTLKNNGPATATDIVVRFTKPSGVVYAGGSEYTATTGIFKPYENEHWTISWLDSGAIATLTVNYFLLQNDLPVAYAEVIAVNEQDSDSTPNNGTPPDVNEDDEASSVALVVCSGDVFLETQADVDAFIGCNVIDGNLYIGSLSGNTGPSTDIHDLSPLLSLSKVGGNIQLGYNDLLVHLYGMENIVSIGKSLVIQNCDNLIDLNPLSGLSGELDYLVVQQNSSLLNIDGLQGISKVNQGLDISGNDKLMNVDGLVNLSHVSVDFLFSDNPSLTSIEGLNNLNEVGNDLIIVNCDSLENLNGLEGLHKAGSFILSSNDVLSDVSAVSNLTNVEHTLFIGLNPFLSDCCVFNDLLQNNGVGGAITIENNAPNCNSEQEILDECNPIICPGNVLFESQADVDAFAGCSIIEGNLILLSPFGLTGASTDIHDLSPLLSLTEVNGEIHLLNNDSLFSLYGLNNISSTASLTMLSCDNLTTLEGLSGLIGELKDINIGNNESLKNLNGLEGITTVSNQVGLYGHPSLENVNGLSGLTHVVGNLLISNSDNLSNINGLSNLLDVGGAFNISVCNSLLSLEGLNNLATAGGFAISSNDMLNDVSSVASLTSVTDYFYIGNNPQLEDCCIFFDLLNSNSIGGQIEILNNAGNCNSENEILQNCDSNICVGDVILETQADVDNFAGCTVIEGDLTIRSPYGWDGPSSNIVDLTPLINLTEVKGYISIWNNDQLISLNGMENIKSCKNLKIQRCESLNNIQSLAGLSGELELLVLTENAALPNIDGLEGITTVTKNLTIFENSSLSNLDGLSNLTFVASTPDYTLTITDNPSLQNIQGLSNLAHIGGNLTVRSCDVLQTLNGLNNLINVDGNLFIKNNKSLQYIGGLNNLTTVGEGVQIQGNDILQDVDAFNSLIAIGEELFLTNNPLLNDCCAFYNLLNGNAIGGLISILSNAPNCNSENDILINCDPDICVGDVILESQADVDAFAGCSVINGDLFIQSPNGSTGASSDIFDLSPLLSLTEVSGNIVIVNNDQLLNLNGLGNIIHSNGLAIVECDNLIEIDALSGINGTIDYVTLLDNNSLQNINGLIGVTNTIFGVFLERNNALENLNGFSNLTSVSTSVQYGFYFYDNNALADITGLSSLKEVGGNFAFNRNISLQSLNGLQNLEIVQGDLTIVENDILNDVSALNSLSFVDQNFIIVNNPLLEDCCIFYDLLNGNGIGGAIVIENNAGNCNSPGDVIGNCQPPGIDLELSMNSSNSADIYTTYSVELTIANSGGIPATGIQIAFAKPAGVVYAGGNPYSLSAGSFDPYGYQIWTINHLAANASATLKVNYFLLQNDLPIAYAQVVATNEEDEDSTPNNGTPPFVNEDDEASSASGGQVICVGDVYLESQEDVDNFPGCTVIDGSLYILPPDASVGPSSDIFDLSPLSGLTEITHLLVLNNNDHLIDLKGLEGLQKIGGGLSIVFCDSLADIQALSEVTGNLSEAGSTWGHLTLIQNASLANLDGLNGITSINSCYISENPVLQNLNGLSGLTSVPYSVQYSFEISNNPSLNDLSGLNNLQEIGIDLIINGNAALESLNGLNNLTTVYGTIAIVDNDNLQDISDLSSLTSVQSVLAVQRNPLLEDCCVFYDLLNNNGAGSVYIQDNAGNCNSPADILDNCVPTGDIDLSLAMSTTNYDPAIYTSVPVILTVANDGLLAATGVSVSFPKPYGTVYTGGIEYSLTQGTFNPFGDELWNVGNLPPGGTASITVNYFLLNEDEMTPYAQVISQNELDVDSAPDNGICCSPAEDDEASLILNAFQPGSSFQLISQQNRHRLSIDQIHPNPTKYWITLDVFAHEAGMVLFDFYNVTGQSMHQLEVILEKGQNEVHVDVSEWRTGSYTIVGRGLGHPAYGRFLKIWE